MGAAAEVVLSVQLARDRNDMSSSELSPKAQRASAAKGKALGEAPTTPPLVRPVRAELIWDGKYDAAGRRVAPLRVALPFQTVETVNESAQDRQKGFQFGAGFREEEWRNRLIWGDKKYVLPSLLSEFAGKVNLIYIDPPFDTGADFSFTATVPDDPEFENAGSFTFTKEPSVIEQKAYRDTVGSRTRVVPTVVLRDCAVALPIVGREWKSLCAFGLPCGTLCEVCARRSI
jgi:hypothetical protein